MTGRDGHADVTLYTLPYCPDCRDMRRHLTERNVVFQEIDLARTPGAVVDMLKLNGGRRSTPTIRIGAQVLVDPELAQLDAALKEYRG
ncbi:MAG TPA: glutaredoxin family protein [Chloroflexia bacterium]|nr:glutaredoxin family protein [Chloroflexia bacterium]